MSTGILSGTDGKFTVLERMAIAHRQLQNVLSHSCDRSTSLTLVKKSRPIANQGALHADSAPSFARPNLHSSAHTQCCLLYTSDAADEEDSVDLGGRRI